MKRKDPDFVTGKPGRYEVQPPIVHPPQCVCDTCPRHRTTAEDWKAEFTIRTRRKSPSPNSRVESAAYALNLKRQLERELAAAVEAARQERRALGNVVRLQTVADAYRQHLSSNGRRLDRDQYVINHIVAHFGAARDAASITKADYRAYVESEQAAGMAPSTIVRRTNTLLAMLNNAVKDDLIAGHQLHGIKRPAVKMKTKPVTFTRTQVRVLLGSAMDEFERRQQEALSAWKSDGSSRKGPSQLPLRGLCLVAYYTLMRPETNFGLTWSQIELSKDGKGGRFFLLDHKNASKGVDVEGALHAALALYLGSIRPRNAKGLVHPNPETGDAYRNIRKQWLELLEIANAELPKDEQLTGKRKNFYTWRHTGASHLAEISRDPVLVTRLMGDTQLSTVMKHYFDTSIHRMAESMEGWDVSAF